MTPCDMWRALVAAYERLTSEPIGTQAGYVLARGRD